MYRERKSRTPAKTVTHFLKAVYFVLMIGISEPDMKNFKPAFDLIVDLFNSPARTLELLKTDSFESFCKQWQK